eukprot:CAMPEP_0118662982 /NCGR_PEP_ID=MMETSP0785-20121206/17139_1 /TAXON_ID=91992 /ORGANISM="Bolidomonas pacifica, Strain CCMP 1866" /LENGTH=71 /DNA_ID=CAMNT_0006556597 /DNA_START=27 /DNA_END=242 /DNA_ORIENTATION=+
MNYAITITLLFVTLISVSSFTPVAFAPRTSTILRSDTINYEAELKKIEDEAKKRMEDKVNELKEKIEKEES